MNPDLTPIATEHAQLAAFKAQAEIDGLLEGVFRVAEYRVCECGAIVEPPAAVCHACLTGNRRLGPLYGGSLAGPRPTPAPCGRCALVAAENRDLARQVVNLKGALETQSAAVRASKAGADPLAVLEAEERVVEISREYETLRDTCAQQANRLAACHCGA